MADCIPILRKFKYVVSGIESYKLNGFDLCKIFSIDYFKYPYVYDEICPIFLFIIKICLIGDNYFYYGSQDLFV